MLSIHVRPVVSKLIKNRLYSSTYQIVTIFPGLKSMSFNCATNIITTGLFSAEPSILTVAPSGNMNRLMRGSIPLFCSTHRMVVGRVVALKNIKENKCLVRKIFYVKMRHQRFT